MKNKKGFTLIELLAVIVILAIIALIAVPIVVNIINDSKKESQQRSIDLYVDTVHKRIIQENMKVKYDPDRCYILENGNVKCYSKEKIIKTSTGEEELKIEMNGKKPESGTITFNSNNKLYYDVELEGMEYVLNSEGKQPPQPAPAKATGEDYRGYYADVDGNGTVDGVIYADLGANIQYPQTGNFYNSNFSWSQGYGTYTYDKATGNLNEYTISKNKHNGNFGEKEIIKLKRDKGNPRFYVMALENFTTEAYTDSEDSSKDYPAYTSYYWYTNAYNKMPNPPKDTSTDFGTGYANTGTMIRIWNNNGEEEGWTEGATQDKKDIWKHIKDKYNSKEKWYIPSRGEWAAFADYFTNKTDLETKLTTSNYNITYGLSGYYWSSSQYNTYAAWFAAFVNGYVNANNVLTNICVRLGVTF